MRAGSPEYQAKYYAEVSEQRTKQAQLLENLRGLGVVPLLEAAADKKILPIRVFHYATTPPYRPLEWPSAEEFREVSDCNLGGLTGSAWGIHKPLPTMDEEGRWNWDLKINFEKDVLGPGNGILTSREGSRRSVIRVAEEIVSVRYSQLGQLDIEGKALVFSQVISPENLPLDAIAQAASEVFRQPKVVDYRQESSGRPLRRRLDLGLGI